MTGDTVIIVSAARGGSACSTTGETIYGTWAEEGVLPLFDAAMTKCKAAIKLTGLPFSGVIWLQGERDANAINDGKMGEITGWLYDRITGIQTERYPDEFGWVYHVK